MRAFYFVPLHIVLYTVTARVLAPPEVIANFAQLKQRDDDPKTNTVRIAYSGCDSFNPKTGNRQWQDVDEAWDDAIKMAENIGNIDTGTDIGSFDYFGPNLQTDGNGDKILSVYKNVASFSRSNWWPGWRVNIFCPSEDEDLQRDCRSDGVMASQWNTLCKDGRCVCETRDAQGGCNNDRDGWKRDPYHTYINIQLCDGWFEERGLAEAIEYGKNYVGLRNRYNLNYYWGNRAQSLFHELLHAATVGTKANEDFFIDDLIISIRKHDDQSKTEEVRAYRPLNAKLLARTIRYENFKHVRQNDDNWTAYALAKYIQKEVGVYPILPLANGEVLDDNARDIPGSLFLLKNNEVFINNKYYADNLGPAGQIDTFGNSGHEVGALGIENFGFNPDSAYPPWYIERVKKAANGDLDGTGPMPPDQPSEPKLPSTPPPGPPSKGKTLQVFWESEPQMDQLCTPLWRCIPSNKPETVKRFYYFYIGDAGQGVDPCTADPINEFNPIPAPEQEQIPAIQGEWEVDIPGMGRCKYQGLGRIGDSGDNGWLHCPDRPAIMCRPDQKPNSFCNTEFTVNSKALSFCDF